MGNRKKVEMDEFDRQVEAIQSLPFNGVPIPIRNELEERDKSICHICRKEYPLKKLFMDHNHKTKKGRGLLCHFCNVMIGFAREDEEILLSAIDYLRYWA